MSNALRVGRVGCYSWGSWGGVRLMNWGCVPGSLNGWVGDSPLFGLMVLGVEFDPL